MELIKESLIEGEFTGFDQDMVFSLISGEKYRQKNYKYKYRYRYRPRVKIFKEGGRLFLEIEGMDEMIEVIKIY